MNIFLNYGITKENLKNNFSKYINCNFNVEKIKEKVNKNNICIFIVYGVIDEEVPYNMAIVTDETNLNYAIYPYEYLKSNDIDNLNNFNIKQNKYNNLEYKDFDEMTVVKYHFSDYKYYAQKNVEKLYNKIDSEYAKKRFGSLENFKEYIDNNISTIKNSFLQSYKVIRKDGYIQYNCVDNYGNYYIFKENAVMQYTIMLDNYTIMTDEDIEYYNKLDKFDKSKYNLVKFMSMINTKDYNAIYDVLDKTFRTNNFKNVDILKQYITNNLYELNSLEIEDYDDETYEYYIFTCKITNMVDINENKTMTIIINQSEGTEFTMSFGLE